MEKTKIAIGENILFSVIQKLIERSAWFEVTPLPDGQWEIVTKPENSKVFDGIPAGPQHSRNVKSDNRKYNPLLSPTLLNQHGREPVCSRCGHRNKVKPLAQYLDEYIEHEIEIGNISSEVSELYAYDFWRELLEQALDAYESTEGVKIKIERVL